MSAKTLPSDLASMMARARREEATGRLSEAERLYRGVLAQRPGHAGAAFGAGGVAFRQGRMREVVATLQAALRAGAIDPALHYLCGRAHKAMGSVQAAIGEYSRALELQPGYAEALTSLGIAYRELGNTTQALECYREAVRLAPELAEAHLDLGNLYLDERRLTEARRCFARALELRPHDPVALLRLGLTLQEGGDLDQAVACYRGALAVRPRWSEGYVCLARGLAAKGDADTALCGYDDALALDAANAEALYGKAELLERTGDLARAERTLAQAFVVRAERPEQHYRLGNDLLRRFRFREAEACFRRVLELNPRHAPSWTNLGACRHFVGDTQGAIEQYLRALDLAPEFADAHRSLGTSYLRLGMVAQAVAAYDRALAARPDQPEALSSRLLAMNYLDEHDATAVAAAHRAAGAAISKAAAPEPPEPPEPPAPPAPPRRTRKPGRLRIGYLSPDLRRHSVAYFLEPILAHHDRERFEVIAYYELSKRDEVTQRLERCCDRWRQYDGHATEVIAGDVERDEVDILIDLAAHAGRAPMLAARRVAPVQAVYLGYPTTSGLPSVDYRITDACVDPEGSEPLSVERLVRLPHSYYCYAGPDAEVPPEAPGRRDAGEVVFGCFNSLAKISARTLGLWARVLEALPRARLLIKSGGAGEASSRDFWLARLSEHALDSDRVEFTPWTPGLTAHLETYHRVDIALDTLPYNGATTTCEALWMGVPVVSRAGSTHAGRMGLSILSAAGRSDWVGADDDGYVRIALALAGEVEELRAARGVFRRQLLGTPLMDARSFTRALEEAYLRMWGEVGRVPVAAVAAVSDPAIPATQPPASQ